MTVLLIEHDMKVVMGISDAFTVLDHGERSPRAPRDVRADARVVEAYLGRGAAAVISMELLELRDVPVLGNILR